MLGSIADNVMVPVTDRARKIGDYLKALMLLHAFLIFCMLLAERWLDALIDLLGLSLGVLSVKQKDFFNISQCLCYVGFCLFDMAWAVMRTWLFFSGANSSNVTEDVIPFYAYTFSLIFGLELYAAISYTGYLLYGELKRNRLLPAAAAPPVPPSGGAAPVGRPAAPASSAPSGFRAFAGEGHQLGGS